MPYEMKILFRFILSHVKLVKTREKYRFYRVFLPILLRKRRQRRGVTCYVIDELGRLSLSKSCPALCHKLIYEIAIFHSINGETCDKIYLSGGRQKSYLAAARRDWLFGGRQKSYLDTTRRVILRPPEEKNYLAAASRVIWRSPEELRG